MSVLVTGGAGYIGSHVVLELLKAGEEPIVLDDLSTGFREAVPDVVKFVRGDVGDQKLVTQVIAENGVEAIIHLAGSIVAPNSVRGPLSYYFNNTCKSWTLFACLPIAARSLQADDPYRRQADFLAFAELLQPERGQLNTGRRDQRE